MDNASRTAHAGAWPNGGIRCCALSVRECGSFAKARAGRKRASRTVRASIGPTSPALRLACGILRSERSVGSRKASASLSLTSSRRSIERSSSQSPPLPAQMLFADQTGLGMYVQAIDGDRGQRVGAPGCVHKTVCADVAIRLNLPPHVIPNVRTAQAPAIQFLRKFTVDFVRRFAGAPP